MKEPIPLPWTDKSKCPKVTVGIPTFNSGGRIRKTLLSVLEQDYSNLEMIISDNCSSDNTQEVCSEITRHHPQVKYFRQPVNIGLVPNFEFVLKQSAGDYFMWIADDDTLEPGIITKYVDFLVNHPDYTLVSGKIVYWLNNKSLFLEPEFNFEQESSAARVVHYYFRVVYGALFYGLMPKKAAERIPLRSRIGDDWHFVAAIAYLGKIKILKCAGYNKKLGGISKDFRQYARVIGANWFSAELPHLKIAFDAFYEILFISPVYATIPVFTRLLLAASCCASLVIKHYFIDYPFIIGGKIKRSVLGLNGSGRFQKTIDQTFLKQFLMLGLSPTLLGECIR
jgi:glycosyltransferase involved in cell wall biosynthesis